MKPDTSHWRDRHSYDFFDRLNIEGLAWECLRRDEDYQALYDRLVLKKTVMEPLPREAERRWGLRFRCQTRSANHNPAGFLVAGRRSVRPALHPTPWFAAASVISERQRNCGLAR